LRNVSNRDLSCELFGDRFHYPVGIAPSAMHKMAHPNGEIATSKGGRLKNREKIIIA
jgi:(S)-2-hydroxy-acid oxidase